MGLGEVAYLRALLNDAPLTRAGAVRDFGNNVQDLIVGFSIGRSSGVRFGSPSRSLTTEMSLGRVAEKTSFGQPVDFPSGSFSISDWSAYPAGVPKPRGPFRILEGAEYQAARNAADKINDAIRLRQGLRGQPVDVHEIHPVKFGGNPTELANKLLLSRDIQRKQVTPWWNRLQKGLGY